MLLSKWANAKMWISVCQNLYIYIYVFDIFGFISECFCLTFLCKFFVIFSFFTVLFNVCLYTYFCKWFTLFSIFSVLSYYYDDCRSGICGRIFYQRNAICLIHIIYISGKIYALQLNLFCTMDSHYFRINTIAEVVLLLDIVSMKM